MCLCSCALQRDFVLKLFKTAIQNNYAVMSLQCKFFFSLQRTSTGYVWELLEPDVID